MGLAIIGGILILLDGVLVLMGTTLSPLGYMVGTGFEAIGLAIVSGVLAIAGGSMLGKPGNQQQGATMVLVFSLVGGLAGGGFIIGSLLGLVGGILGFSKR